MKRAKKATKRAENSAPSMANKVEMWPIEKIRPYKNNARLHSESQIRKLMQSIKEFGFNVPLLVNKNSGLIAGHCRLEAAMRLKMTNLPVIVLTHLSDEKKRAFIIADNRMSDLSGWDDDMLAAELATLEDEHFNIAKIGFSDKELDAMLGSAPSIDATDQPAAHIDSKIFGGSTAKQRSSVPFTYWQEQGHLTGNVLDFGCGNDDYGFARYDAFSHPDIKPLLREWDVVVCNYVLNIQPSDHLVMQIIVLINKLLRPGGTALFAVRQDIKHTERGERGVQLARTEEQWQEMIAQAFHVEAVGHKAFYGFVCKPRHIQQEAAPKGKGKATKIKAQRNRKAVKRK